MPGRLLDALRASEWVLLACFAFIIVVSFYFPTSMRKRWGILFLNAWIAAAFLLLARSQEPGSPLAFAIIRDWLPAPLILVAYHEAGLCVFPRANHEVERVLASVDNWLVSRTRFRILVGPLPRWLDEILESCYLLCYPVVPLGLGALYIAGLGRFADEYWTAVLPALLICYSLSPFFPALPPRALPPAGEIRASRSTVRRLNLWILKHGSIQANVFPSAHVAGAVAASLAVMRHLPALGAIYLLIAVGIVVGSVRGKYHYAADCAVGALAGLGAFTAQSALWP